MIKSRLLAAGVLASALAAVPVVIAVGSERAGPSASDLSLIVGVMNLVQKGYVHPVEADELTKDALKGMLSRLDPHSDYMDEQEFRQSQADIAGKFGGLGIQISQQAGIPKVSSPIDGTPAARAGIQPGDLIISINRESTHGMDLEKVVALLRGKPGTSVDLTISRGTQPPFDVKLTRSIIQVQTVNSRLAENGVGYVRVSEFGGDTPKEFRHALDDLKRQSGGKLKGLVLDLRNDPGGLLAAAVDVSSAFLDGGAVVSVRGRSRGDNRTYNAPTNGDILRGTPIVVLINGASASASEIVAGALQDRHRATVIGTQSFGKGSVQTVIPLNGHGALRLTTALYYTPAGRSIQGEGIVPEIVVEAAKDEQVEGAVMTRESGLYGAFTNPGPMGKQRSKRKAEPPTTDRTSYSAPIKAELIGTPHDAQLNAAFSRFDAAG